MVTPNDIEPELSIDKMCKNPVNKRATNDYPQRYCSQFMLTVALIELTIDELTIDEDVKDLLIQDPLISQSFKT